MIGPPLVCIAHQNNRPPEDVGQDVEIKYMRAVLPRDFVPAPLDLMREGQVTSGTVFEEKSEHT